MKNGKNRSSTPEIEVKIFRQNSPKWGVLTPRRVRPGATCNGGRPRRVRFRQGVEDYVEALISFLQPYMNLMLTMKFAFGEGKSAP